MGRQIWLVAALLAVGWIAGCDKGGPSAPATPDSSASPPTTEPAATQPSSQPAAESHLSIDGKLVAFPTARLRVNKANGQVMARLYTVDPKAALADDYVGNGYDLMMTLDDISEPTEVYNSFWQFKSASREFSDSPHGIFLEGIKYQLQPADVTARFLGDMLMVRVQLKGQFLQFDQSNVTAPPRSVYVEGFVLAPVEYKD